MVFQNMNFDKIIVSILLTVILFILSISSYSQDYSNLIEKGKLNQVIKKCSKNLQKDSNDIESLYFMSVSKSKLTDMKICSPSESYYLYTKLLSVYHSVEEYRIIEKLNKIQINETAFKILSDSIFTAALLLSEKEGTEDAYINFLNTYRRAPEYYKRIAIKERNRIAFDNAKKVNTIESYNSFISKYPLAIELPRAIEERNIIAYSVAEKNNTIESYKYFIDKYPEAVQINEAWDNIYIIAFNEAKRINTINSYENFIKEYPKASQVKNATNTIHKIAFSLAKIENTSEAYKSFIEKYPSSELTEDALELYQSKDFQENTIQGNWESYKYFYETRDNKYKKIAIDSMVSITKGGNINTLKYLVDKRILAEKTEEIFRDFFNSLKLRGEYNELIEFKTNFYNDISNELKLELEGELSIAANAEELFISETFNPKLKNKYLEYIRSAGEKDLAFVALQRLISKEIEEKRYADAVKIIESQEKYFVRNEYQLEGLKEILKNRTDISINLTNLANINSLGNEYSPVISANNENLFFCGKDRLIEDKNEHLYLSVQKENKWSIPMMIDLRNSENMNNAPLANSSDGNTLFMFSDGDIYETSKTSFGWSELKKMSQNINSNSWEGDLSISSDNNTLIFARGDAQLEKNIDIVFLVDATGSMGPCINGVKENIYNFIDGLQDDQSNVNWRAKIIYYRDFQRDGLFSYVPYEFTNNLESLRDQLNYAAGGGDDEPESTIESIFKTIKETNWRDKKLAARVIITFTDATNKSWISPASTKKYKIINPQVVKDNLLKENIRLFLFAQNSNDYDRLRCINSDITLYDNAVSELQNADYSVIMNDLSQKVSLLSSNTKMFHGDRLPLSDLYISQKNTEGEWQKPIKLPSIINTAYTERSPFLHPDMKTLYFSSDGHGGVGKLDVFKSTRISDSCWDCWSEPINLGKEINSPNSDWGYKISTDGQTAYFSKATKSKSREDIFKITLPPHLRPDIVARVEGELKNSKNQPLSTTIRWEDLENNKVIGIAKSDPMDGSYFIVLPMGKNYGFFVEDSSYFPLSQNLDLRNATTAIDVKKDIIAISFKEMIDEGIAVPMNNLFFEFGKYNLLPSSIPELTRIAKIIKAYKLKVEIDGHTDDIGDDNSNKILSERRANSVREFLINRGCDPELLITFGFGETKPLTTNDNDANRAKNRRVELKFIK